MKLPRTIGAVTRSLTQVASAAVAAIVLAGCVSEQTIAPASRAGRVTRTPVHDVATPAGAGSAEPFLFATRDGLGLSWLEPVPGTDRTALRVALHTNNAWSAARTIVERNDLFVNWADFPSVVEDGNGALFAHWLQKSGPGTYAYDVVMTISRDRGETWSSPFLLNRDGKEAEHGFVTLAPLPGGGVGATWLDGRHMTAGGGHEHAGGDMTIRYATVDANGAVASDVELDDRACECCTTGMTIASGRPLVVYRDRSPDEIRDISYVRAEGAAWTKPRPVRADGWKINACPVNGPQIDSIGDAVATAWFTAANEEQRVYAAFSADGGNTFEEAMVVDDGKPAGRVDIVMTGADAAIVSWLEQTASGAEIRARRIRRAGSPSGSLKISDSSTSRATGFTRIARFGEEVWFAWTEHGPEGQKRVRVARARIE